MDTIEEQMDAIRTFMSDSTELTTAGFEVIDRGFKMIEAKFKMLDQAVIDLAKVIECSS